MSIQTVLNKVVKAKSKELARFEIAPENFIEQAPPEGHFVGGASYFEIIVHAIFLQNRREYWQEYIPLGITLTEAIYGYNIEQIPFIIGPQLLGGIEQVRSGDHITYRNIRVAGRQPYMGDQLMLFSGLWRNPTKNYAKEFIAFVERIGKAVNISQPSVSLLVTTSLVDGLETLLGLADMDLRVGFYVGYSEPSGSQPSQPGELKPAYIAMIRKPHADLDRRNFWVTENQLYYGTDKNTACPYIDADYMLLSIKAYDKRGDITTFLFHKNFMEAKRKLHLGDRKGAEETFGACIAELSTSPDFSTTHRLALIVLYRALFQKEIELLDKILSPDEVQKILVENFGVAAQTVERAGFSIPVVQGMRFGRAMLDQSKIGILDAGDDDNSMQQLFDRVFDYGAGVIDVKEFNPQEMTAAVRGAEPPFIYGVTGGLP